MPEGRERWNYAVQTRSKATTIVEDPLQEKSILSTDDLSAPVRKAVVKNIPAATSPDIELPESYQNKFYKQYYRPLDPFRYKADLFWNGREFVGKIKDLGGGGNPLNGANGATNLPFFIEDIGALGYGHAGQQILHHVQPQYRRFGVGRLIDQETYNPFRKHVKELIVIKATRRFFGEL